MVALRFKLHKPKNHSAPYIYYYHIGSADEQGHFEY